MKVLILVPHQDDEVNIAGQILPSLIESNCDCYVCFSTNGDASLEEGLIRANEAEKVAALFGLPRDSVIFLGFPNDNGVEHLYDYRLDAVPESYSYSAPKFYVESKWNGLFCNEGTKNNREGLLGCLKRLFVELLPDVILCVDYDNHIDHRTLSQLSEQALGEVVRSYAGYRPVMLKKFAYACAWQGENDYYSFRPCSQPERDASPFELDNPSFRWGERISLSPHPSTLTKKFKNNLVYKAFSLYQSQGAWPMARSVCNCDIPFWVLRTDNLIFDSQVTVSSGSLDDLLDLRRFDADCISGNIKDALFDSSFGWIPASDDCNPSCCIRLNRRENLQQIRLHLVASEDTKPSCIRISVDGQSVENRLIEFGRDYRVDIVFDEKIACERIDVSFGREECNRVGLRAVELLPCFDEDHAQLSDFIGLFSSESVSLPAGGVLSGIKNALLKLEVRFCRVFHIGIDW